MDFFLLGLGMGLGEVDAGYSPCWPEARNCQRFLAWVECGGG